MHIEELPWPHHVGHLYACLRHLPWASWLDSGDGEGGDAAGRWHLLVADPRLRILSEAGRTRVVDRRGKAETREAPVLEVIRQELAKGPHPPGELPFAGGALGYFSYDFGRRLMGLPSAGPRLPEVAVGIHDWAVVLDCRSRRCWIAGQAVPPGLAGKLAACARKREPLGGGWQGGPARRLVAREAYADAFQRIRHYLREGDCYQINYAQPFEAPFSGDPLALYLAMREANPAPYGAFLDLPFATLLSASPEQFLRLREGVVTTRPIKGTRPRGATPHEDQRLHRELAESAKDRAENLMIVDLLRNDLGRVCAPGTIEVPELFAVETFPTVHHLVSTVRGRLAPGEDALGLLAACFPGGSITGAPKRRAMEIIQELEGRPREVYCGSIGWIGYDGNMETSIAIRTLQIRDGRARYWAGGGIVIDSELEREYEETLHKAAAFFRLFDGGSR